MNTNVATGLTVAVLALALILGGYGLGFSVAGRSVPAAPQTITVTATQSLISSPSGPYVLTLVVTTKNIYNSSVGEQPAFFVLGPSGLESAASISLPANRLIKLVILNYDDGNLSVDSKYTSVSGTVGNSMLLVHNDNVNASQGPSGIIVKGGENVTAADPTKIAHTFTVPSLSLNIPLPVSSTVVGYFTIAHAGTYKWFCMTPCGSGGDGLHGAMTSLGWMTGTLVVS